MRPSGVGSEEGCVLQKNMVFGNPSRGGTLVAEPETFHNNPQFICNLKMGLRAKTENSYSFGSGRPVDTDARSLYRSRDERG